MRFPNADEVERAVYYGQHMKMRTSDAVLRISAWTPEVGAIGPLHKAWVRVRNIPPEKRCDATVAYVGSLVGIILEVDHATVHKAEYVRNFAGLFVCF